MSELGPVHYHFESAGFAGVRLGVTTAQWRESLGACYRAEIDVVIESPDEDFLLPLGKDGVLTISRDGGLERRLVGVVTEVEQLESPFPETQTHLRIRLEPALALLGLGQRTRMFQEMKVGEILTAVLEEGLSAYQREIEVALDETYPAREYCLQYRESDLAFAERLMQEEGISYTFDQEGDVERLVLIDRNGSFISAPIAGDSVPFSPRAGDRLDADEVIHDVQRVSIPRTQKVSVRDHDWTSPAEPRAGEAGEDGRESYQFGLGAHLTLSGYSGDRYGAHDGDRQAGLRLEALARDATVLRGRGRVIGFAPGVTFTLSAHSGELDGDYVVTAVDHHSRGEAGAAELDPYTNRFECIPIDTPFRPARVRPKPRIPSVQTAVVTGPAGEEIHCDSHGRVKVQFPWDLEGANDERSSCWLRVQQEWAGNGWGFLFVPRIGMEVVVHFVHGDPDRPVVHGCVYNSENRPPYPLPDEKTKSTIKSNTSLGGGGFNELRFEDLKGSEQIYLHAQKDLDEVVLADHTTQVGGDQTNTVGNDQTQTVDGFQTEMVDGDQTMTVDGNRTVTVAQAFKEIILAGEKRRIGKAEKETITSGGETRVIVGTLDEDYVATELRAVIGGQTEVIVSGHTQTVGAAHAEGIIGSLNQVSVGNYTVTSTGSTFLADAGSTINIIGAAGGTLAGTTVNFTCTDHIEIDPHQQSIDYFKSSSGGTTEAHYTVGIDIAGLSISATGLKLDFAGIAISLVTSKLNLLGVKLDLDPIAKGGGATSTKLCFHLVA